MQGRSRIDADSRDTTVALASSRPCCVVTSAVASSSTACQAGAQLPLDAALPSESSCSRAVWQWSTPSWPPSHRRLHSSLVIYSYHGRNVATDSDVHLQQ